jgi:prepilin-type N-terminal cleavage/methylation domain-containing protein
MRRNGFTLIELVTVLGVTATVAAGGVPQLLAATDALQAVGAVRYVAARLQQTRMEAVMRSANVAIRFVPDGGSYSYAVYQDGNGNGVSSRDIQRGVDTEIHPAEKLPDAFSGVDFGVMPSLPPADPGGTVPGTDPIKLGSSNMVSFSSSGTSSTGTLYVLSRQHTQYAVVIFGDTGKTRVLQYDLKSRQWRSL